MASDPFQCHVYLIVHGDQSVLIDPGSVLLFPTVLEKINKIIPFEQIRYFICQHQDPDITGILPQIDLMPHHPDAVVVSHWRINALLKHYALHMPLMCIEECNWKLNLGGRELRFIFTPYLHSPGAFCTFDPESGVLFSSDLFGGFTESPQLFAQDERIIEGIRVFHEHYMPSRDVLLNGLFKLETLPIQWIAPQHGSIIPAQMIPFVFNQLKDLDCGLYLITHSNSNIQRLVQLNNLLKRSLERMVMSRDFAELVNTLLQSAMPLFPVKTLRFYGLLRDQCIRFGPETHYRGTQITPPRALRHRLGTHLEQWKQGHDSPLLLLPAAELAGDYPDPEIVYELIIPLLSTGSTTVQALATLGLTAEATLDAEARHILEQLSIPLGIAVERELIFHSLDKEREKFYQISTRDQLTGLYTRFYMRDAVARLCELHDRGHQSGLAVAVFDIDHFKRINDTYGHQEGDAVLKRVARVLLENVRNEDIPVRMGGEEFVVFLIGADQPGLISITERILNNVRQLTFSGAMHQERVTISCGLAFRRQLEPLDQVTERADISLYAAKRQGRDRVQVGG
ncbi:MAG: diguanylate cyclase [Magnetococcales bacterium]|nr:diguanylate cyclase [Magnetococcales bacterium]NGZ07296.1 diguanylate cyclase [Magnetococcales bacterium]